MPIQDVRTRWNSTFLMLQRARRLSTIFERYCVEHNHTQFQLNAEEWRQIDYLICITQPFHKWTTALSKVKDVTVHNIFRVYNMLFGHLETSMRQLRRKKVPWKQAMLSALDAGMEKLKVYYNETQEVHGNLYAIGTILAPQHKLQFFSTPEWADNDYEWRQIYLDFLKEFLEPYTEQQSNSQGLINPTSSSHKVDEIEQLFDCDSQQTTQYLDGGSRNELQEYLDSGKLSTLDFLLILIPAL